MGCLGLLFIVTLTTVSKVTSLHCSDQQLLASGDDDLQQVTTLQYCLVDNCTIMMIDTGEELDIMYATDGLIITTPTDGRTPAVINKLETELPCTAVKSLSRDEIAFTIIWLGTSILLVLVDGYIAVVHLLFKQLHNLFGMLLLSYSLSMVWFSATTILLAPLHIKGLYTPCHYLTVLTLYQIVSFEVFAACILHHLAHSMYRTYKIKPKLSKAASKLRHNYYLSCWGSVMLMVLLLTVGHDVISNNATYFLPNDDCEATNQLVLNLSMTINTFIKTVQIAMFAVYLYYKYRLSKDFRVHDVEGVCKLQSQKHQLNIIAIAMGATVGVSQLILCLFIMIDLPLTILGLTFFLLFIEQCVIMTSLMCTKKMKGLCNENCFKK